jgi:hypothetical protein
MRIDKERAPVVRGMFAHQFCSVGETGCRGDPIILFFCVKREYFKRVYHLLPLFWNKAVAGACYALRLPMCPQKPSPHPKIRNPTDLVNKFVLLARMVLVVPHHPIFCFVVLVDAGQSHRNWKSPCVCVSRTHEQIHSNPVSIPTNRASRCSRDENRFGEDAVTES